MQNLHHCNFEGLAPYQIYAIRLIEAKFFKNKGCLCADAHIECYNNKLLEEMNAQSEHCTTMSIGDALEEAHDITENRYKFDA